MPNKQTSELKRFVAFLMSGFSLFAKAFRTTYHQIWVSGIILLLVTAVFAIALFFAEHSANPDYSFWDALVWTFVKYVEDPADIVSPPITVLGQVIGTLVGVLGIAIFAVPAGLIGSGLMEAMDENKREKITAKNSIKLHKCFRRISQSNSWFYNEKKLKITLKAVPRYRSLAQVQVKTGMTNDEIIAAVNNCPDMRLMNMATTMRSEEKPQDRLVIVHFPLNREYGCCVDRGSDVTIVAPVAVTEPGTGSFAFSMAAMGGFNYVSKELTPNPDDPLGFYSMQKSKLALIGDYDAKEDVESQALHFMDDLKCLKQNSEKNGRRHWFIFIMGTTKSVDCQVHFWRLATDKKRLLNRLSVNGLEYGSTVTSEEEDTLQAIYSMAKMSLEAHEVVVKDKNQHVCVCMDNNDILKSVGPSNIMCRMGGGVDCNSLTIRIGYEILAYHSSHLLIAKDLADAVKVHIEPERNIPEEARRCFMEEGDGYADEFCKMEIFDQSPNRLRKMIENGQKYARKNFERFDLDGNIEERKK
jgi:voltage-gated potassium channel